MNTKDIWANTVEVAMHTPTSKYSFYKFKLSRIIADLVHPEFSNHFESQLIWLIFSEDTNYFFEITKDHLYGALDRYTFLRKLNKK